jgi:two-component system, OmpR family, response regulator
MDDAQPGAGKTIALLEPGGERSALLSEALRQAGYAVRAETAAAALAAPDRAAAGDLYLLDLTTPRADGMALVGALRRQGDTPIVVITGKANAADRAAGLELGADDHVAWPCDIRELLARIQALLRRHSLATHASRPAKLQQWTFAGWRVDSLARRLRAPDDRWVDLTASEYRLLEILISHPGQTQSRASLLSSIYQRPWSAEDRSIDNLVVRLRRKLREDPRDPQLIRTVRGGGYVMTAAVRMTRQPAADGQAPGA